MFEELIEQCTSKAKKIINEGLSKRLFHFCSVSNAYLIAETDSFKLSSIDNRTSDAFMTSLPIDSTHRKQYQYYMCFSRTPSSLVGYVAMRRDKTGGINWQQTLVRFEVDGEKLSSTYKGMPVNFFNSKDLSKINHFETDSNGNPNQMVTDRYGDTYSKSMTVNALNSKGRIVKKDLPRYTEHKPEKKDNRGRKSSKIGIDYGSIDRNQMLEYEDRLFSNQEYIKKIKEMGYIKRVDIYLCKGILNGKNLGSKDTLFMVNKIIEKFGDLVHVYDNFSSFEGMNIVNSITGYDFKEKYLELNKNNYFGNNKQFSVTEGLSASEYRVIIKYATILAFFGMYPNWENDLISNTIKILKNVELNDESFITKNVLTIIEKIKENGIDFFQWQTHNISKEFEKISPFKYKKYIHYLDVIQMRQINEYEKQYGKRIGIFAIKANYYKKSQINQIKEAIYKAIKKARH